jgi:hypothetical protein
VTQIHRPARLATRAASFRYGGRHHSGIPGDIIPLYPGDFVGIRSLSSSPLPIADQAKQFCNFMQRNVSATFDLGDKLSQAKDMQEALKIQSEFVQEQMRTMTDQAKSMGESAMKAATGVFIPKS